MKEISKYLVKFIKEKLIPNDEIHIPLFSIDTMKFLMDIMEKIKIAEEEWKKMDIIEKTSKEIKKEIITTINNRAIITSEKQINFSYVFRVHQHSVCVNVFHSNKTQNEINECIHRIFLWLYMICEKIQCSPELVIFLDLTEYKKILPMKKKILDEENINTGFTTNCNLQKGTIYIFREEEWFKVFIHETFHILGLDFSNNSEMTTFSTNEIQKIFNVNVNVYETYCELNAQLMNIIFYCYFQNKTMKTTIQEIHQYITYEIAFSLFQMVKILKYNKMEYIDFFKKNNYKEKTNVFSYYFLKTIFIMNIHEYFYWITNENRGTFIFYSNENTIKSFLMIAKKNYKKNEFLKKIIRMQNIHSSLNKNTFEMKTLRMSFLEF